VVSVHPHVHGELAFLCGTTILSLGSSPRAWGTRLPAAVAGVLYRFIPTCMGNSFTRPMKINRSAVHPHVHGELSRRAGGRRARLGSSPRAWGTPGTKESAGLGRRFIPTCMGNSASAAVTRCSMPVHPHVHGELPGHSAAAINEAGSSPRAWGTLSAMVMVNSPSRFIPTCMGNSLLSAGLRGLSSVHPHVHGELGAGGDGDGDGFGSSPRAWGTRRWLLRVPGRVRFIPTCMGNSGSQCRKH